MHYHLGHKCGQRGPHRQQSITGTETSGCGCALDACSVCLSLCSHSVERKGWFCFHTKD
uniref:Uncharacterized protein n=1 Tax=Anguilla anguilla TaxID=7936 RepID=A0A0E9WGJ0_ANGAN